MGNKRTKSTPKRKYSKKLDDIDTEDGLYTGDEKPKTSSKVKINKAKIAKTSSKVKINKAEITKAERKKNIVFLCVGIFLLATYPMAWLFIFIANMCPASGCKESPGALSPIESFRIQGCLLIVYLLFIVWLIVSRAEKLKKNQKPSLTKKRIIVKTIIWFILTILVFMLLLIMRIS